MRIPEVCKCCGSELTAETRVYLASKEYGKRAFTIRMLMKHINLPHAHIGQACLTLENKGKFIGRLERLGDKNGRGKSIRVYMRVR